VPAVSIGPGDLDPFADIEMGKALAMCDDALARASRIAPCIVTEEFEYPEAAKAILRGAILRWHEAGTGVVQQQGAGPFQQTVDTRQPRKSMFWPSEIQELQALCAESGDGGAFAVDTVATTDYHAEYCALKFGANYCDCGAVLAGYPLW
jgi:hypothetical protein